METGTTREVLDHGWVVYVGHSGSDRGVVEAARTSTGVSTKEFGEGEIALLERMARQGHRSPFYHPHVTLDVKWPLFVARQAMRHHVGHAWNERSMRYTENVPDFYAPPGLAALQLSAYMDLLDRAVDLYLELGISGVSPETRRMVLPVSMYTEARWTFSLYAGLAFVKERTAKAAQKETRVYAGVVKEILAELYPASAGAWFKAWGLDA